MIFRSRLFVVPAVISVLMLTLGCAAAPVKLADESLLSRADERMLWQRAEDLQQSVIRRETLYAGASLAAYVNRVAARLRPHTCPPELEFNVYITSDPFMNAHAYPNGLIIITSGLLARLENEAQLAAVLAHEMAHCIGRDALRAYRQCSGTGTDSWQAGYTGYPDETRSGHGNRSEELSECLQDMVRRRESVADASSLDMLVAAQYDPAEAVRVFYHQKEALALDGRADRPSNGSHPLWHQRMKALEEQLAAVLPGTGPGNRGRAAYHRQIQPVLLLNAALNLRHGRYQWARSDLRRYLRIQPEDARAHHLLGETYQQQGGKSWMESALACYYEAIRLDVSYAAPHKALGILHYKQGRKQLARRFLKTALVLAPDDRDRAYLAGYLAECQNKGEP